MMRVTSVLSEYFRYWIFRIIIWLILSVAFWDEFIPRSEVLSKQAITMATESDSPVEPPPTVEPAVEVFKDEERVELEPPVEPPVELPVELPVEPPVDVFDDEEGLPVIKESVDEIPVKGVQFGEGVASGKIEDGSERNTKLKKKRCERGNYLKAVRSRRHQGGELVFNDQPSEMTYGRRVALALSKHEWYMPKSKNSDPTIPRPNLNAAWEYFEHYTLPRQQANGEKAEAGEEEPTKLYSVLRTPLSELSEWGVGINIYFWTLRALALILLVAGFINIPNIMYFNSDDYSAEGHEGLKNLLKGSSICTDQRWVACPTCSKDMWDEPGRSLVYERYATVAVEGEDLNFILRNFCEIDKETGYVALATLLYIFVSIYVLGIYIIKKEVDFDESEQTASDYSILVQNPPTDAKDPDEWKKYFEEIEGCEGQVVCVTLAKDNETLINNLARRRKMLFQLELLQKPGVSFDYKNLDKMVEDPYPVALWRRILCCQSEALTLKKNIEKAEEKIKEFKKVDPRTIRIFVTFNSEEAQRSALRALTIPLKDHYMNNLSAVSKELLFRGKHLLKVLEPTEPSTIRWHNLDENMAKKVKQRILSYSFTFILLIGCGFAITYARRRSAMWGAIAVSGFNSIAPQVVKYVTKWFESHVSEGQLEASLYFKLTLVRWMTTAVITTLITPFTNTLSDGSEYLIQGIYAIFCSELIRSPLMQLSDYWGNSVRHYFGPRAPDQFRMNLNFQGGYFSLANQYTELTKVLFFTLYFSTLFPGGFFFGAFTLLVQYYTDKFSLLRSWGDPPKFGSQVSIVTRNYLFTATLVVYACTMAYQISGFPYDDTCDTGEIVETNYDQYLGTHIATTGSDEQVSFTIRRGDNVFQFCDQDMLRYRNPSAFPPIPSFQPDGKEWMTTGQEDALLIIGWTCVAVLAYGTVIYVNRILISFLRKVFCRRYKPSGEIGGNTFTHALEEAGIGAYVPQVKKGGFNYPLLVCDISKIDTELLGWQDPDGSYDEHNLIFDFPDLGADNFSTIKYWPASE